MTYEIRLSQRVKVDLARLAKNEPKAFAKANRFLDVPFRYSIGVIPVSNGYQHGRLYRRRALRLYI